MVAVDRSVHAALGVFHQVSGVMQMVPKPVAKSLWELEANGNIWNRGKLR